MSYDLTVDWHGALPSTEEWQSAIDRAGFPTVLDSEKDSSEREGWWPAEYDGSPSGFQFLLNIEGADCHAFFSVGAGNKNELLSAASAAAALAHLTRGKYTDPQLGQSWDAEEVLVKVKAGVFMY
jgi:hypothetical protein